MVFYLYRPGKFKREEPIDLRIYTDICIDIYRIPFIHQYGYTDTYTYINIGRLKRKEEVMESTERIF